MKHRRLTTMDIHALLRRFRANESDRRIAKALHLDRKTVAKYRSWAEQEHLLVGPLPDLAELQARLHASFGESQPPQNQSSVEAYRDEIVIWLSEGKRPRTIYQLLSPRPGFTASESAVRRLIAKVRPPTPPDPVMRLETAPGQVAQVDFGEVGTLIDPHTGQPRKAYVFVMVLAWSRHLYAEFVFDQKILTWLLCHQHAFEWFGGVPARIVLDNLKAAIIRAYAQDHEVEVQRAYAECAEHYDFLIDPCLPARPQHKGKVERGVGYIQGSFIPLLPAGATLPEANAQLRFWITELAGEREHGTTHQRPYPAFVFTERRTLQPLPPTAYDPGVWKQTKLHRDGHVVFEKAFYSAPYRYLGQTLWLRAGLREIRLFAEDFTLVATHTRATQPGQRLTQLDHFPPNQVAGATASRTTCQTRAAAIGPATAQVVADLLAARPVDKLRTAVRVLHLADTYTPARLEAACQRALAGGEVSWLTLKHILAQDLDRLVLPVSLARPPDERLVFARSGAELAAGLAGGAAWK